MDEKGPYRGKPGDPAPDNKERLERLLEDSKNIIQNGLRSAIVQRRWTNVRFENKWSRFYVYVRRRITEAPDYVICFDPSQQDGQISVCEHNSPTSYDTIELARYNLFQEQAVIDEVLRRIADILAKQDSSPTGGT